ncbi:amidase [Halomarina pelagica]|uniref:amidase n=1 Tax=Halomarina pelagica TaxID=2961599 RepID=UPI0020C3766F|nr:amidase family protein [Halomarina sp. BND7]
MSRLGDTTERDVAAAAERIGLDLGDGERAAAVDRIAALSGIYDDLEVAPVGRRRTARDVFETTPYRPDEGTDPHNAWLWRFDLVRPGGTGVLDGLDVAVKNNVAVRGVELTCGSRAFEGVVADAHAEVVERLLDAGGRIVGATNMDELAFGPTSETSAFGPTTNPVDADRVTGGSSSGSAAAVAAGDVDLALGSDTGGSVRIPASYCGIVGHKPTYDLVPRRGFVAMAYSMDHVGPLARDVETAARGLTALADAPPGEPTIDYAADLGVDVGDLTLGVCERFFETYVAEGVEATVRDAVDRLADRGATVREVEIPGLERSREAWWGIAPVEFAATYATAGVGLWRRGRVDPSLAASARRVRDATSREFGDHATEMLALGGTLLDSHGGTHYVRAQNLRADLTASFDRTFEEVDLLVSPSTPTTALGLGEFERGVTPPVNWNTHPANLTGHPAASVPCGEAEGLPVGLQFVGPTNGDKLVLDAAYAFERAASATPPVD